MYNRQAGKSRTAPFGMYFVLSKCKVLLQDCASVVPKTTTDENELAAVNRFSCLGTFLTEDGSTTVEVRTCMFKARAMYGELRHLWCQSDGLLKLKGCLCV